MKTPPLQRIAVAFCLLNVLIFRTPLANADTLKSIRGKTSGRSQQPTATANHSDDDHDDDDDDEGILGGILNAVISSKPSRKKKRKRPSQRRRNCNRGNLLIVEEHYHPPVYVEPYFTVPVAAPSIRPAVGPASPVPAAPVPASPPFEDSVVLEEPIEIIHPWHARFGIDYGFRDADVSRFGFDFRANASGGLGIDLGIRQLRESSPAVRDHLWLGDFNVTSELFPTEQIRPRAGIGISWLGDRDNTEAGFNLTVGCDIYLSEFWVVSGEVDFGTLGSADISHSRVTLGFMPGEHAEWYVGYDHLNIGGIEIGSAVTGLGFRF